MFSLIIPVHNRADFLPRLFRSLDAQCLQPDETILVDNASQDGSQDLCRAYAEKRNAEGGNVRVLQQAEPGACATRNMGLQAAREEYVFFFDSDDEISADFLKDVKARIENASQKPKMICAPAKLCFADGKTRQRAYRPTNRAADQIITAMLCTQSMVINRAWLMECGGWDEELPRWNDWELGVRLLLHRPQVVWLEDKAYHRIHQHPKSITGNAFSADQHHLLKVISKVGQMIDECQLTETEKQECRNALAGKQLLLSAQLYRENDKQAAEVHRQQALFRIASPLRRTAFSFLQKASACGLPGVWRLYAALM